MLHDDKGIEGLEKDAVDNREITSPDFVGMVLQESEPVLTARFFSDLLDVLLDGPLVHHNLQLEELAMYFLGAPTRVLESHLLDKLDGLSRDSWLTALGCGFPFPVKTKQISMPA